MYAAYLIKAALEEAAPARTSGEAALRESAWRTLQESGKGMENPEHSKAMLKVLATSLPAMAGLVVAPKIMGAPYSAQELAALKDVMGAQHVRIRTLPDKTLLERYFLGAHADSATNTVGIGRSQPAAILAHELGHLTGSRRLMKAYGPSMILGQMLLPAAGSIPAYTAGKASKNKEEAVRSGALRGALAGTAMWSPVLAEEARASWRASQALRKIKAKNLIRGHLGLLAAYATYLGGSAGIGAAYGAGAGAVGYKRRVKLLKEWAKKQEAAEGTGKEKTA